jgi:uncharacterized membrane protein YqiK
MLQTVLSFLPYWWVLVVAIVLVWIACKSFVNVKSTQIAIIERKYFGKEMQDGRTVALKGEVGVQAAILGPGLHILIPFIQTARKAAYIKIEEYQIGIVEAITGKPIPSGKILADDVDCDLFQDGEAFLRKGGQKGKQIQILPPGEYRINTYLFKVEVKEATVIEPDEVGIVDAIAGEPIPPGKIMAAPVDCNLFQDAKTFLSNGGQKGPQLQILTPGTYRINTYLFNVEKDMVIDVNEGKIRLVTARDGEPLDKGRILAKKVEGHSNFEKAEEFIKSGGQRGQQIECLMPGRYRINTRMFDVSDEIDWVEIGNEQIGVVTTLEGKPLTDNNSIAAEEVPLEIHSNFQNAWAFIEANGQKGLQIPVLRAGKYAINPWFAKVDKEPITTVPIGMCAVVTSYVGDNYDFDTDPQNLKASSQGKVNAKLVPNGYKGIWKDPLGPGKHALNPQTCKWDILPTTQVVLSWANVTNKGKDDKVKNAIDENLSTITLRTADAFDAKMDVQVMFHIPMEQASAVVADLGSMADLISQVLEPAVSSHFRNAAQTVVALDLYTKRAELAEAAKKEITQVLGRYHIESRDVMITDVVLPEDLTTPVRQASVAAQEKAMYNSQKDAQEARKDFEHAQKEADMQDKLVESARSVEISKNNALAAIEKATGEKQTKILDSEGQSQFIIKIAEANAHKTEVEGQAEATVILRKGQSQAEAYRLSQRALGDDFARLQMIEAIAKNGLPIIPQNILIGGEKGGGIIEQFMGISMIEKLTGKPFNGSDSNHTAPEESFIVEDKHDETTVEDPNSPTEETGEGDGITKVDSPAVDSSPAEAPTAPKGGKNHRNKK